MVDMKNSFITIKEKCMGARCQFMSTNGCTHPSANRYFECPDVVEKREFAELVGKAWNEYCIPLPNTIDELNKIYVKIEQSIYPPAVVKEITKKLKAAVSPE